MPTLYAGPTGNGRKPLILVKLLDAPINIHFLKWPKNTEIKSDWYLKINPNGSQPSLYDEEKNLKLFESNLLLQYISNLYDEEEKFSYKQETNFELYWEQRKWLDYQSAQFSAYTLSRANNYSKRHSNDEFTKNDVIYNFKKIYQILEDQIIQNGTGWIIGNKFTIVDIAWLVGNHRRIEKYTDSDWEIKDFEKLYPNVSKWYKNCLLIKGVQETLDRRE
ncbi:hypothetical protein KGF54_002476 [Candida jiufengensis]|uniref:uncharacterized protein n=1 Tax=Candida jiufengensis TaxID=497108 RepID=UPI0022255119|nr:uncharacterized protein KGF54_002476 [Candida jiufengensis]KAI5953105.1 hypothetical protein KGF54_002476 [Candida jiufengensis]